MDELIPSVHDGGKYSTQYSCLHYMSRFTKGKKVRDVQKILMNNFLPHIGTNNFIAKSYYLGYMVLQILLVKVGIIKSSAIKYRIFQSNSCIFLILYSRRFDNTYLY